MADSLVPKRRHAALRIAAGFALIGVVAAIVRFTHIPALEGLVWLALRLPLWLVYTIVAIPAVALAGTVITGIAYISLGLYDLFEDVRRKQPIRPRRDQAIGDLVIGAVFVVATVVAAVVWSRERWWMTGTMATTLLTMSIGVLVTCRGAALMVPRVSVPIAAGALALGIASVVVGVKLVPVRSAPSQLVALALVILGLASITEGIDRLFALRPSRARRITLAPAAPAVPQSRRALIRDLLIGAGLVLVGTTITLVTYQRASMSGGTYVIAYGPIVVGVGLLIRALMGGFKSFVAWRYLLVFEIQVTRRLWLSLGVAALAGGYALLSWRGLLGSLGLADTTLLIAAVIGFAGVAWAWGLARHAKIAFVVMVGCSLIALAALVAYDMFLAQVPPRLPDDFLTVDPTVLQRAIASIVALIAGGIAGLALYVGTLRAFFTFFTTVPIVGVWIGTAALVCVLSVMSGFETDLRDKILGSNAHIQITREDGAFTNWRDVKTRIDKIPGVVASTPYAVSEVVIAAHNNGMNVIIKGIDPATVGEVTDLIEDLEDPRAIERLEPKEDTSDRVVPQVPQPHGPDVIDPPPPDLPSGGEPIDFSGPDDEGSAAAPADADLVDSVGAVVDPPPDDLLTTDAPPDDYSGPDSAGDRPPAIGVSDLASEPSMIRRIESLPGVLVGRELVKQTHMYTGEEVRIVSPLSDPSNPDATGTPIPFNRDFRVAGTFYTGMYEYDLKYIYVTLETLQDFLDRGEEIDGIEVRIADPDDTLRFVPTATSPGLIREALGPGYRVADWRELNRSLFAALSIEKIGMFIVLGIVILVASFSIVGNLIMVVVEKAREIALLKTLGASDFAVTQLFAIQGLMIGVIGTVLGVATGLLGCWAGKRYGIPLNPDVYYIDRLPVHIEAVSVVAAAIAGVVISILATLYPALLAARVRPAAGMRH